MYYITESCFNKQQNQIHSFIHKINEILFCLFVFVSYTPPTAKVIWRHGPGSFNRLEKPPVSNLGTLVYKASGLST